MENPKTFFVETVGTPTGAMLIVTDGEQRLRAIDWEDHEERAQRLLQRYYPGSEIQLREAPRPTAARRSLEAYFEGELDAVANTPTATNGTEFQRMVWDALRDGFPLSVAVIVDWPDDVGVMSVSVTGPLAFAGAFVAAFGAPTDANSAAADTKLRTLPRIGTLSLIKR